MKNRIFSATNFVIAIQLPYGNILPKEYYAKSASIQIGFPERAAFIV